MPVEPLEHKQDWPRAVERLMAWWQCEVIDRACVQVTCRRRGMENVAVEDDGRHWLDTEWQLNSAEASARRTAFIGEAFPTYWPNIGPETLAVYLGARVEFSPWTSWTYPLAVPPGTDWPEIKFDPANRYYQWVKQATLAAVERFKGKIIVGVTDFHNAGDTLAAIRDPQQLCLDMLERPDRVRETIEFLRRFRQERFDENVAWTLPQGGTTTWLSCFSTGVYACTQVDFIVLIGPAMFREFILDELNDAGRHAEHVCYHLDGPGEIKHLDRLLAMDNLHAIQWVPGAGGRSQVQSLDLLRRIRAAGKGLHLSCEPEEVVELVEELGPAGLLIRTGVKTQDEAERLIRDVERASAKKK
jgi:hypothetical protein